MSGVVASIGRSSLVTTTIQQGKLCGTLGTVRHGRMLSAACRGKPSSTYDPTRGGRNWPIVGRYDTGFRTHAGRRVVTS